MRKNRIGTLAICGILLVALVALSLIPLASVSRYDRMCYDDYDYSVATKQALTQGGSFKDVLTAAGETVAITYQTWQGTYSAVFLFALQPAIWGQSWYFLTPLILIATLLAGLGYFLYVVCARLLSTHKSFWLVCWMLAATLCLQFPRDAAEGLFWYNGGLFYTFFFSLLLIWCALALDTVLQANLTTKGRWIRGALLAVLTGILAGGNYPTALLLGIVLTGFLAWCIWKRRDLLCVFLPGLVVFAVGFLLSVSAPGNAIRQAETTQLSPLTAIATALLGTPKRILGQFFRFPGIVGVVLLVWVPLCIVTLRESQRKFRLPLLLPVASYLILAAMFTPSYFAMGYSGPYRLWNIVIFVFYLLLLANVYYFAGWWKRRFPVAYGKVLNALLRIRRFAPAYVVIVVCMSVLLSGAGPDFGLSRENATSVRAAIVLHDGSARAYAEAFDTQEQGIVEATEEWVGVLPIPQPGDLIPDGDLTYYLGFSEEPGHWYGKNLVIAQTGQ